MPKELVPPHDASGMYLGFEYHTLRVYEQMTLSAFLLATIVASLFPSYTSALDRLAIDNAAAVP